MKRMAALAGALLLTLVLATPAVAIQASTYTVATAYCSVDPGPDYREWGAGPTWHVRDAGLGMQMFLLIGDAWEDNGWRYIYGEGINGVPNKVGYTAQGKIEVRDSQFGDFDGAWMSNMSGLRVTLNGLDGADYDHLKISVVGQSNVDVFGLPDMPDWVCEPPVAAGEDWFEISTWTLH